MSVTIIQSGMCYLCKRHTTTPVMREGKTFHHPAEKNCLHIWEEQQRQREEEREAMVDFVEGE